MNPRSTDYNVDALTTAPSRWYKALARQHAISNLMLAWGLRSCVFGKGTTEIDLFCLVVGLW